MQLIKYFRGSPTASSTTSNRKRFSDLSSTRSNMGWEYVDNGKTYRSFEHQSHRESPRNISRPNSPAGAFNAFSTQTNLPWAWWYLILIVTFLAAFLAVRTYYEVNKDSAQTQTSIAPRDREDFGKMTSSILQELEVIRDEQRERLSKMSTQFQEEFQESMLKVVETSLSTSAQESQLTFINSLRALMLDEYQKMRVDPVGQPDYANSFNGAKVAAHSKTHMYGTKVSGPMKLFYEPRQPQIVIDKTTETVMPGNCWPFEKNIGFITIELPHQIMVTAISYEHASPRFIPPEQLASAPKIVEFNAGLTSNTEKFLGQFAYDIPEHGPSIFKLQQPTPAKFVKLSVLDNHGEPNYTCIYRIRVYGQPI